MTFTDSIAAKKAGSSKKHMSEAGRQRLRDSLAKAREKRWLVRNGPAKWIMSFSGGKDSTAMLHVILREKLQLDEVMTFASDWDFPGPEEHLTEVEKKTGVVIKRINPPIAWYDVVLRWGWPHAMTRWCTGDKGRQLDKHTRGCGKYIGIAYNERHRAKKYLDGKTQIRWARFPLIDYQINTWDCMKMCTDLGYTCNCGRLWKLWSGSFLFPVPCPLL